MYILGEIITNVDCSDFVNNTGIWILFSANASEISVTRSEFVDNTAIDSI